MNTLIELYDERPIENVLASEVFRPERTVFLCPPAVAQDKRQRDVLQSYFRHKGLNSELIFLESSLYNADKVALQLRSLAEKYPDAVVDITGGTDAALFACGKVSAECGLPAFTYSRKRRCFFGIHNAPFENELPCTVEHRVEDCFLMAGGKMRQGRVNNAILSKYAASFRSFFDLYLQNRDEWASAVTYFQRVSQNDSGLKITAPYSVGGNVEANERLLYGLQKIGFLSGVSVANGKVSFAFRDEQVRTWLRDVGSVLELFVYQTCLESGLFSDVRTSAVVDWEGKNARDDVTNEIDVMAMKGILPVFISCKTCAVATEALNELAILRDRFGGKGAVAAIVTTKPCRSIMRNRAAELNIDVIDFSDLKNGKLQERLVGMLRED